MKGLSIHGKSATPGPLFSLSRARKSSSPIITRIIHHSEGLFVDMTTNQALGQGIRSEGDVTVNPNRKPDIELCRENFTSR